MTTDLFKAQKINGRDICGKRLIICEGPAGAGKSTLLNGLHSLPEVNVVTRSLSKRTFERHEAGVKSFINDTIKIIEALTSEEPVVFIDRCIASQRVYDAIRSDGQANYLTESFFDEVRFLVESLEGDLAWRTNRRPVNIEIYWLFLIPRESALKERRSSTAKTYPHSVIIECHHYRHLCNQMVANGDYVLRPSYDNPEDTDHIIEAFEYYLKHFPYLDFPTLWRCFAESRRIKRSSR